MYRGTGSCSLVRFSAGVHHLRGGDVLPSLARGLLGEGTELGDPLLGCCLLLLCGVARAWGIAWVGGGSGWLGSGL